MNKIVKRFQGLSKKARTGLILGFLAVFVLIFILVFNFSSKSSSEAIVLGARSDSVDGPLADFDLSSLEDIEALSDDIASSVGGFDFTFDLSLNENILTGGAPLPPEQKLIKVLRVIDGDTLELNLGDKVVVTRLIGVNAPEKKECLYVEATEFIKKITAKGVYVFTDKSQGEKDKYGRTLLYIKTYDDKDLGNEILKAGLAREYTYGKDYELKSFYVVAQNAAQIEGKGIWGKKCESKNKKDTENPEGSSAKTDITKDNPKEEKSQASDKADDIEYPININTATSKELQNLPRIGEKTAQKIIDYREENGDFTDIEDIQKVSGIGEKIYGNIKDLITI